MTKEEAEKFLYKELQNVEEIRLTDQWIMTHTNHLSPSKMISSDWDLSYYYVAGMILQISHRRMETAKITVEYQWDGSGNVIVTMPLHGKSHLARWWKMIAKNRYFVRCESLSEAVGVVQQIIDMSEMIYGGKNAQN